MEASHIIFSSYVESFKNMFSNPRGLLYCLLDLIGCAAILTIILGGILFLTVPSWHMTITVPQLGSYVAQPKVIDMVQKAGVTLVDGEGWNITIPKHEGKTGIALFIAALAALIFFFIGYLILTMWGFALAVTQGLSYYPQQGWRILYAIPVGVFWMLLGLLYVLGLALFIFPGVYFISRIFFVPCFLAQFNDPFSALSKSFGLTKGRTAVTLLLVLVAMAYPFAAVGLLGKFVLFTSIVFLNVSVFNHVTRSNELPQPQEKFF